MSDGLVVAFSTVGMGSMGLTHAPDRERVLENRRRFAASAGRSPESLTTPGAVHGIDIARVDAPAPLVPGVDGLITASPELSLLATFADCYPLVLFDPVRRALGLGHAGWRGTAAGIGSALVTALGREFGTRPGDLRAVIGPGICGDCYEVGPEFAERFEAAFLTPGRGDRLLLDLREANRRQLVAAGVPEVQISLSGICTFESDEFFSHRRAPDGARFATLAFYR